MKEKKVDRFTTTPDQIGKAKVSAMGKKHQATINRTMKGASNAKNKSR